MQFKQWLAGLGLVVALPAVHAQLYQAPRAGSGAAALGYALGSGGRTRQDAYADEQMRMLQRQALIEQIRAEQSQADQADALTTIQAALHSTWLRGGADEEHASAYAQAYHFADDDQAVWLSVEGQTAQQVGAAIRKALDARNFQLADQLLLGAVIESARQPAPATSSAR